MNAASLPNIVLSMVEGRFTAITPHAARSSAAGWAGHATETPAGIPEADAVTLQEAVDTLNTRLDAWATSLRFEIDTDISRVIISVVDRETGQTIRQIPSEQAVHLAKELGRLQDLAFKAEA